VSKRDSYAVRMSGLGDGLHDFSFELDHKFFAGLDHSEIQEGNVRADVVMEKKPGVFSLHFTLKGEVEVVCDRCLEAFMARIDTEQTLFIRIGEELKELEDNVLMIHRDDYEIEISQILYEYIILALPFKRVHPDVDGQPECNPDMLDRLEAQQGTEEEEVESFDPRWDKLKGIIDKKE